MDRIGVRRKLRRHFLIDLLESRVGIGAGEVRKNAAGPAKKLARFLERDDRVLEGRLLGLLRDRVGFLFFLGDPLLQRRLEMFVLDLVERRELIGQRAFRKQRIGGGGGGHFGGRRRRRRRGLGSLAKRHGDAAEGEEQQDGAKVAGKEGRSSRTNNVLHK